jgi:ankyrin repeat protein
MGQLVPLRVGLPDELQRSLAAEHSIALLPATCRHCTERTTRGALASHELSCASAPDVKCAAHADGCGWTGRESDRAAHQAECAIVRLCARFDVERKETSQATASVVDALLSKMTSKQARTYKNIALCLAAAHDSLAPLAMRLLAGGAEVDAAGPSDGYTPLGIACEHGNVVMVERLIAAGSRVDNASIDGATPLFLAAQNNRLDVVKLLIAAGADVNKAGADGCTPLHVAVGKGHAGVVSVLVETAGVDLNAALTDGVSAGVTPLFVAAQDNRLDVVTLLIAAGADVNKARANDGSTPLHKAAQHIHAGVVSVFIETVGVDLNAALTDGELVGVTPLFVAAQDNRLDVVTLLIAAGADVTRARFDDGCTPLHMTAQHGHAGVVDLSITAGANVRATSTNGATALSTALAQGHAEVVQKLRAAGAN